MSRGNPMSFLGLYDYQLDDKKRVAMPPRYRDQFDGPAILISSKDPCIAVYTQKSFEAAAQEIESIPAGSREGREARRRFFGTAEPVTKDGQGRLLIPQRLIDHAALKKDVLVVGVGAWFEIWDRDSYLSRPIPQDEDE